MSNRRAPQALLLAILTAVYFYPLSIRGVDMHHDGLMMKTAWDLASGQEIFRETFAQYGPITAFTHAGALLIFGKTLWSLRFVTLIALSITAFLLTQLWNQFLPKRWVWLSIALWIFLSPDPMKHWTFMPWSSVLAMPFQLGAILFWLRADRKITPKSQILAGLGCGICSALTFWTRTPVGVFLTAALFFAEFYIILKHRERFKRHRFFGIFTGLFLIHTFIIILLFSRGLFSLWFDQCILLPANWAGEHGLDIVSILRILFLIDTGAFADAAPAFPVWQRFLSLFLAGVLFLYPLWLTRISRKMGIAVLITCFALAAGLNWEIFRTSEGWGFWIPILLIILAFRSRKRPIASTFFWLTAMASWLQVYPVPCPRHIFWAVSPAIGLVMVFYREHWVRERSRWRAFPLILLILPLILSRGIQYRQKVSFLSVDAPSSPLLGIKLNESEFQLMEKADHAISQSLIENPQRPMLLLGPDSLFLVWAKNLENAHPVFVLWDAYAISPKQSEKINEQHRKISSFIWEKQPLILAQKNFQDDVQNWISPGVYAQPLELGSDWGKIWAPLRSDQPARTNP